jgi:hypothetical protein
MRAALTLILVLLIAAIGAPAHAQPSEADRDAARALATAGFRLFSTKSYEPALERFRSAEAIIHAPPHVLYIARCLDALGRMLEARDSYRKLLEEQLDVDAPVEFRKARAQAEDELVALLRKIPRITVVLDTPQPADVRATLDAHELSAEQLGVPLDVDPGTHQVVVTASDGEAQRRSVTLAAGGNEVLTFGFGGGGDDDGPGGVRGEGDSVVGPAVLLALGGVGILVGAVTGGLALKKKQQLKDACPTKLGCPAEAEQFEKDGRKLGAASTVGFVVGGVAAAAGITWLVFALSGDDASNARVLPLMGPADVGLRVRF